jgi:group I intron endonuclease
MISAIYAIRNLINGKMYIGSSSNFDNRKSTHLSMLRSGKHHSPILQRAWVKYGEPNFVFDILENVEPTYQILKSREQYYLNMLSPEYNISDIADGHFRLGKKNTPDHCAKISASNMGRISPNKGKKFSDDHRRKLSESHIGKPCGRPVGYHHSAEAIEKMRAKALVRTPRVQSVEERSKRAEHMKNYWKALSPEQLSAIGRKISEKQRQPDRQALCVICQTPFPYRPNGVQKVPMTCSKPCLKELQRQILKQRTDANPEANRNASLKRWANYTPEQRSAFGKALGLINRKPDIEAHCIVCGKKFLHKSMGKQTRKTCSLQCLSKYRSQLITNRMINDPEMWVRVSNKRWIKLHH